MHQDRDNYHIDIEPVRRLLRKYSEPGPNGIVEFWYLDYISTYAESIGWMTSISQRQEYLDANADEKTEIMEAGYQLNQDSWFSHHARTIEDAYIRSGCVKIREKYIWLSSYHNEIAPKFSKLESSLCTVK